MRAENVKVGQEYLCQVGKNSVRVTLVAVSPKGQMTVQSVASKKKFQVADAARLSPASAAATEGGAQASREAKRQGKTAKGAAHGQEAAKTRKTGLLDAALQVLREAGQPMNTKEMVDAVLAKGLWKSDGKTPAATLYSSILRELQKKGDQARFVKTERGKFAART